LAAYIVVLMMHGLTNVKFLSSSTWARSNLYPQLTWCT